MTSETATLAGGCFWCLEAVFDDLRGVASVESGYMGGDLPNPSYRRVCDGGRCRDHGGREQEDGEQGRGEAAADEPQDILNVTGPSP